LRENNVRGGRPRASFSEMGARAGWGLALAVAALASTGCTELFADEPAWPRSPFSEEPEASPPALPAEGRTVQVQAPGPTTEDDFWLAQRASEYARPPPERPRSISLGYISDDILAGGVTRYGPLPARRGRSGGGTWQSYMHAPSWPGGATWQEYNGRPNWPSNGRFSGTRSGFSRGFR